MRGLRPGRDILAFLAGPRAGGAVAERKNVLVARRLQRRQHDELVDAIGFQTVEVFEHVGCLHTGRPHHELGRNERPRCQLHCRCP